MLGTYRRGGQTSWGPGKLGLPGYRTLSSGAWATRFALVSLFLLVLFQNGRLVWNEWQIENATGSSLSLTTGAPNEPAGDERVWLQRANLARRNPSDSASESEIHSLEKALRFNPRDGLAWVNLGLAYEHAGQIQTAAAAFAMAETVDRQYLSSWARANFAFRQRDGPQFWKSATRALSVARTEDLRPWFDLADRWSPPRHDDLTRLIQSLGYRPVLVHSYLDYLIDKQRWCDAVALGLWMEASAAKVARDSTGAGLDSDDIIRLSHLTTRLISSGQVSGAIKIWNGLPGSSETLGTDSRSAVRLVNGRFEKEPSAQGFDWRLDSPMGIRSKWAPGRLEFQLTGDQPDQAILLEQPLVIFDSIGTARAQLEWHFRLQPARQTPGPQPAAMQSPMQSMDPVQPGRAVDLPSSAKREDPCTFRLAWELESPVGRWPLPHSHLAPLSPSLSAPTVSGSAPTISGPASPDVCEGAASLLLPPAIKAKNGELSLYRLQLVLRRAKGSLPIQGTLVLYGVAMATAPGGPSATANHSNLRKHNPS